MTKSVRVIGFEIIHLVRLICLLIMSCGHRPYLWYPNTYQTGRVLEEERIAVALHTVSYIPLYGSFTCKIGEGWQAGIGLGQNGGIGGIAASLGSALSLTRRHLKRGQFFSSITLEAEGFLTPDPDHHFSGMGIASSYSLGFYPFRSVGLFVPVRIGWIYTSWDRDRLTGFFHAPGIGGSLEFGRVFIRGAYNQPMAFHYPFTNQIDYLVFIPYVGLQLGYRW